MHTLLLLLAVSYITYFLIDDNITPSLIFSLTFQQLRIAFDINYFYYKTYFFFFNIKLDSISIDFVQDGIESQMGETFNTIIYILPTYGYTVLLQILIYTLLNRYNGLIDELKLFS